MIPFRKILFPIDYSEACVAIVPYVKDVLRFSAELTLVHAYAPNVFAYGDLSIKDADLAGEARARERARLQQFAFETFPGHHVECFADLGEPGAVIHAVVQNQGTDLVMLPTRGYGPFRRFLLGSVAAKVLHDVSAAVWTISATEKQPQIPYRSILCALDGTDESECVLTAAVAIASEYKASLRLAHVVETPPPALDIDFTPYKRALLNSADFRIRELKGKFGLDVPHAVIDSVVEHGIRDEALRRKSDLLIIGRGQAQRGFGRLWSHIFPIVRECPCPVLSI
jgi:nucleotide-binding universal stress UspA family protein